MRSPADPSRPCGTSFPFFGSAYFPAAPTSAAQTVTRIPTSRLLIQVMSRKNNCRAISDPRCNPSFRYRPGMEKFSESSGAPRPPCIQGQLQTMYQLSCPGCAQDRPNTADRNAIFPEISVDHRRHHSARSEERNKPGRLPAMPIEVSAPSDHLRGTVPDAGEPDTWIAKAMKPRKSSRWPSRMDRTTSRLSF